MGDLCKTICLALGLSLILTARLCAGPLLLTDDPEPVDLQHWEAHLFTSGKCAAPNAGGRVMDIPSSAATAVLVIFALTYLGIALGHVPGLKLNRTGIALLGAIAIIDLFRDVDDARGRADQLADHPALVRLFRDLGATAALRFFRPGGECDCRPAR